MTKNTKIKSPMPSSTGFKKYIFNTLWLFAGQVFSIATGLGITIWMARYLGPERFGLLNYAISFVGLFGILSSLGLNTLVPKELLAHPDDSPLIMGTSFTLSLLGALILLPVATFIVALVRPGDETLFIIVLIIASSSIFNSFNIIKYWFESHVQAKSNVKVSFVVNIISLTTNAMLLYMEAPLIAFAWLILLQSILLAFGYSYVYVLKSNKLTHWRVSFKKAKYLLLEAYPLILSGAVFIIFIRIDQVMLGSMAGDTEVGIYAVAVRLSESWMFIPGIIASSFFPAMLNVRKNNYKLYLQRTQHLLNIMALLGVSVAIATMFISPLFINLVFGEYYDKSADVLIIHIWGMLFYSISIISFRYFIAEGLQIYSFYRAFAGLILNIVLNYFLIPFYGATGAAIATVISQIFAVWVLNSVSPKTREMFFMQTKALLLLGSINTLKHIKTLRKK